MIIIREMYGRLRTMPRGWRAMEGRRPRTRPVGRAKTGDGGPRRAKAGQGGPRRAKAGDGRGGRRKKRRDVCRNQIAANRPCGWNFQLAASASSLIYFNLYLYTHTHTHTHTYTYIYFLGIFRCCFIEFDSFFVAAAAVTKANDDNRVDTDPTLLLSNKKNYKRKKKAAWPFSTVVTRAAAAGTAAFVRLLNSIWVNVGQIDRAVAGKINKNKKPKIIIKTRNRSKMKIQRDIKWFNWDLVSAKEKQTNSTAITQLKLIGNWGKYFPAVWFGGRWAPPPSPPVITHTHTHT